jgi:hypothetical protein
VERAVAYLRQEVEEKRFHGHHVEAFLDTLAATPEPVVH